MVDKSAIPISNDGHMKQLVMPKEEKAEEEQLHLPEEEVQEADALLEPPKWLPDGWIMEVYRAANGTINQYYISPVSGYTFTKKSEVLAFLFSETDERILESEKEFEDKNILQKSHRWLPEGWVIEVRAGGEKMDKMYKFYVHTQTGLRVGSKEDVELYDKDKKISKCDSDGQCDTRSQDNLLAKVELNPKGLPNGWVKEDVFRKTKKGTIRRDPYYTDHVSGYTFRTLKSALSYLEKGKISKCAFIQITSVHDLYSFEKSTDLHESLRTRLGKFGQTLQAKHDRNTNSSEDGDTLTASDSSRRR